MGGGCTCNLSESAFHEIGVDVDVVGVLVEGPKDRLTFTCGWHGTARLLLVMAMARLARGREENKNRAKERVKEKEKEKEKRCCSIRGRP